MTSIIYKKENRVLSVTLEIAEYLPSPSGTGEWHLMLHPDSTDTSFTEQLHALAKAYKDYKTTILPKGCKTNFARCFVSDAANQEELVNQAWNEIHHSEGEATPLSIVQQPPLNGSKLALWVYLSTPSEAPYTHLFKAAQKTPKGNSEKQTAFLLEQYEKELEKKGCTIERDCIRTWLFVRDVDVNYAGVVKGRTENFLTQGMNPSSHYIASTGIQGQSADPKELVLMDTYAIKGLKREQIQFLYAKSHLNPTYEYNVTFERGVSVLYGDRRHVLISGTASIDNKGKIVHPGNIRMQTQRMWENVEALLQEASCTFEDVAHMIVYLRDIADYNSVKALYDERFPQTPKVFLLAPVCRPGWLIEMECMAIKEEKHPDYPAL